jgi:Transposase DDE domain/LysR substrate binding domain
MGELADSGLIARALEPYRLILCAAPSYLAARGPLTNPMDLEQHDCLGFAFRSMESRWDFDAPDGRVSVPVATNQVVDMGLLQATAEPAREILGVDKIDVVADAGYFRTEDIAVFEKAGLTPHVPRPQRGSSASHGFFRKDEFRYDPERDAYACPAGHELKPFRFGKLREMTKIDYANKDACRDCPLRPRCTDAGYRAVSRLEHEAALDRMASRLELRPNILDLHRETVEHPFGSIKQWMNQGAFLMRGLEKVRAEFSLTALAYNLRRVLNILGMDKMMAAVGA